MGLRPVFLAVLTYVASHEMQMPVTLASFSRSDGEALIAACA